MANATPALSPLPPPTPASAESCFTDSAIDMEMNTSTISPQSKPPYESEVDTTSVSPADSIIIEPLAESSNEQNSSTQAIETTHQNPEEPTSEDESEPKSPVHPPPDLEQANPHSDLITHLTTTVSSLRLRHAEQSHLHTLFTSKLEALAQRSLEQEATIRSLTAELKSLRDSTAQLGQDKDVLIHENEKLQEENTQLNQANNLLTHENRDLHLEVQDLRAELKAQETAMEAMTGAVRGLEGWIESAGNSPRSNSQARVVKPQQQQQEQQQQARESGKGLAGGGGGRKRSEVVRGKGRFRGRHYLDDDDDHGFTNDVLGGMDGSTSTEMVDTAEIQEGVMAWVRGFRDVEEGLKARSHENNNGRDRRRGLRQGQRQLNGRQAGAAIDSRRSNDAMTTDMLDEEFGDFVTGS